MKVYECKGWISSLRVCGGFVFFCWMRSRIRLMDALQWKKLRWWSRNFCLWCGPIKRRSVPRRWFPRRWRCGGFVTRVFFVSWGLNTSLFFGYLLTRVCRIASFFWFGLPFNLGFGLWSFVCCMGFTLLGFGFLIKSDDKKKKRKKETWYWKKIVKIRIAFSRKREVEIDKDKST